jgi:hypothetical protein
MTNPDGVLYRKCHNHNHLLNLAQDVKQSNKVLFLPGNREMADPDGILYRYSHDRPDT